MFFYKEENKRSKIKFTIEKSVHWEIKIACKKYGIDEKYFFESAISDKLKEIQGYLCKTGKG